MVILSQEPAGQLCDKAHSGGGGEVLDKGSPHNSADNNTRTFFDPNKGFFLGVPDV